MSCDKKPATSVSELLASSSGTKLVRSTCWQHQRTNEPGEKVIDGLRVEACNVEFNQGG